MKKQASELVVDSNFNRGEASSKALKDLVGFFYNSKFSYKRKIHSKELGNYRITYVFSRLSVEPLKK